MTKSLLSAFLIGIMATGLLLVAIKPSMAISISIIVPDDYPTITGAISRAVSGDTIFVKSGTYQEPPLTIDKSISLVGEDANNTIIKTVQTQPTTPSYGFPPPPEGATIRIAANNVTISGFTLTGETDGIAGTGDRFQITKNIIIAPGCINLQGNNQNITQNTIRNPFNANGTFSIGYGITIKGYNNNVTANRIDGANNYGIAIEGDSSNNSIIGNTIEGSVAGISLNGNGNVIAQNNLISAGIGWNGISLNNGSYNTIYGNRIPGGVSLMGFKNTSYSNDIFCGISIGRGSLEHSTNFFYNNNFFLNDSFEIGLAKKSPGPIIWDNDKEGNYWSDYTGTDANYDGIGDSPYAVKATYDDGYGPSPIDFGQDNYPLMLPFNIDNNTITMPSPTPSPSPSPSLDSTPSPSIPEFPSWIILALILMISISVILLIEKKRKYCS